MRIAIITFFQSQDNYGQLLQCYALQRVIRQMGHKPYLIRYGFHEKYFHWLKKKNILTAKGRHEAYRQVKELFRHRNNSSARGFDLFRKMHLAKSLRCYNSLPELRHHPPKAECYITGSDQVWAQLLSDENNKSFFLDFGPHNTKRISYAPSFAVDDYPSELKKRLTEQLSKFDAISVREQSGVRICKEVGYDANLVLDPTLLLTADHYKALVKKPSMSNYCFVYHVNITSKEELLWNTFHSYNDNHNLASVATFANPSEGQNMEFIDGANYVYPTIEEWLGLVQSAEYVLTSSFHGLVFSILFHKPFVVCLRKETLFAGNDRIMTLLNLLGLNDRIVSEKKQDVVDVVLNPINWLEVEALLNREREKSLSFLNNALKR